MPVRTDIIATLTPTILTITSGAISITRGYHTVAAESGTADDLATINIDASVVLVDGANTFRPYVFLRADAGDTITVKHGTGNIALNGAADFELSGNKQLLLLYDGTNWTDIGTGGGSGGSGAISADTLVLNDGSELTIATGAITVTHARHSVDTEADAASDDLATVNGLAANEACIITANNTARTVVVKHGTGNISCATGADITLDDDVKAVCLLGNIAGTGVNAYPLNGGDSGGAGDISADTLVLNDGSELTIATGAITVTHARHSVDTEADAASDDLATVNGLAANEACIITANNTARTVVVKHGTDNITSVTGSDITIDDDVKAVCLLGNIAGTGVNAYPLFDEVTPSSTTTFTNKTITDLKLTDATELTIATGAITATQSYHSIDTESDAASDDLDTINGGVAGDVLYIFANNDARTVVVKNNTGNILTYDGNDVSLDEDHKVIELLFNGTNWRVVGVVGGGSSPPFNDNTAILQDSGDNSKQAIFDVGDIDTATTRTFNFPNANGRLGAIYGSPAAKSLASDVLAVGGDRNIVVSAQTSTTDDLIEVTGLAIGESVLLRAASGHTITVKHNDVGATVKIHLSADANVALDEQNPLRLTLVATNVLVEDRQPVAGGGSSTLSGFSVGKTDVGSALAAGAWRKLECVEVDDPDTLISVASSVITFAQSGLYALVDVWIRFSTVSASQVTFRLRNTTTSANAIEGTSAVVNTTHRVNIGLSGIFAATASDTFELQIFPDDQNATQEAPDTFTNAPGFTPFALKATFIRLQ